MLGVIGVASLVVASANGSMRSVCAIFEFISARIWYDMTLHPRSRDTQSGTVYSREMTMVT